jgi:hypothetical protein
MPVTYRALSNAELIEKLRTGEYPNIPNPRGQPAFPDTRNILTLPT